MRIVAIRLYPGDDVKECVQAAIAEHQISAGAVLGCVGALSQARLRMAGATPDAEDIRTYAQPLEIISLMGNIGPGRIHLHMAVSDAEGQVIGGHLKEGCIIDITAELVIGVEDTLQFTEKFDPAVGFDNLEISKKND